MARLAGDIQFTGSLNHLSAYRMQGVDRIIIRRKGGVSRERIKNEPAFAATRRNNSEWTGCTRATGCLVKALHPLKHLASMDYAGRLNGIFKSIQADDRLTQHGKRAVLISQHYHRLEGFQLNRQQAFESLVRHPLQCSLDKAGATAGVAIPDMVPGISLVNPERYSLYRLVCVLGAVPDIKYSEERKMYMPAGELVYPCTATTGWHACREKTGATLLSLSLAEAAGIAGQTLFLAAGIEFGVPVTNSEIRPVKRSGAARLLIMA